MIQEKTAFIISMFDEYQVVIKTLMAINKNYKNPLIIVVKSDDGQNAKEWQQIKHLTTKHVILPNLAKKYPRFVYPSYAVSRNFSEGFSLIDEKVDYIVALLGDTLISNPKPLHNKALKMKKHKRYLCVCKAYGQFFNNSRSKPTALIADRYQDKDTTDFSAVLFIVDGDEFRNTKWFTKIKVTNDFTSEQCLGDHTLQYFAKNEVLEKTLLLNEHNPTFCYSFTNGITYHAVTGKPGRDD